MEGVRIRELQGLMYSFNQQTTQWRVKWDMTNEEMRDEREMNRGGCASRRKTAIAWWKEPRTALTVGAAGAKQRGIYRGSSVKVAGRV